MHLLLDYNHVLQSLLFSASFKYYSIYLMSAILLKIFHFQVGRCWVGNEVQVQHSELKTRIISSTDSREVLEMGKAAVNTLATLTKSRRLSKSRSLNTQDWNDEKSEQSAVTQR